MKQGIASLKKFAKQGGVLNYLGKQKTVNAPIKWKSSAKHPVAFLAYITKEEMDILIKKNIYGSLKGKPNKGPFGLPSLQGSGSGSEGAGSAAGGQGGSEGFSSDTGPSPGEAVGMGALGGSEGFDSQTGPSGLGFGQQDTFASDVDESNVMSENEEEDKSPQSTRLSPMGIAAYNMSLMNPEKTATEKAIGFAFSPISTTLATIYDSSARGPVTPGYESFDQDYGYDVQTQSTLGVDKGGGDLPYPFTKQNTQKSGVATLF